MVEQQLLSVLDEFMEQPTLGCRLPPDDLIRSTVESEFNLTLPPNQIFDTVQELLDHLTDI